MKKVEAIRAEYRREDLGKGVRGKHYAAFQSGGRAFSDRPNPSLQRTHQKAAHP